MDFTEPHDHGCQLYKHFKTFSGFYQGQSTGLNKNWLTQVELCEANIKTLFKKEDFNYTEAS